MKTFQTADACGKRAEALMRLKEMCTIKLGKFGGVGENVRGIEHIAGIRAPVQGKVISIIDLTLFTLPRNGDGRVLEKDIWVLEEAEKQLRGLLDGGGHGLALNDDSFSGRTTISVIERGANLRTGRSESPTYEV